MYDYFINHWEDLEIVIRAGQLPQQSSIPMPFLRFVCLFLVSMLCFGFYAILSTLELSFGFNPVEVVFNPLLTHLMSRACIFVPGNPPLTLS